ncbi:sulfotransferase [Streptomyces sp. NPDC045456]|uniref:sulfotransferase n=1 Tax=Streptomyces sp. NPDC045456 TaxID=3155254 RepID=UPI0033CF7DD9
MTTHSVRAPQGLGTLHRRLDALRPLRGPAVTDFLGRVGEVVVLACSSRGGSSMVAELLRYSRELLHFQAETNPFLRLAGLGHPESRTGSDALGAEHAAALEPWARSVLAEEMARDAGSAAQERDENQLCADMAWRLIVQWPELPLEPLELVETVRRAWRARPYRRPTDAPGESDEAGCLLTVLEELSGRGLPVDPRYYDLPKEAERRYPSTDTGLRAPGDFLVEEPPFVVARPWRRADLADLRDKPLVVKTPSNAYRLHFLRSLFPQARFRVLHLTRNPAAAVNGLYDGWRHHGFHAHRMEKPLGIHGYVEQNEDNQWWWKFDLPPGWEEYTGAPLADVCAFQWRSAHEAVLGHLTDTSIDRMTVRFEDLTAGPATRIAAFEKLSEWLGISLTGGFRRAVHHGIRPVVATARPREWRWKERAGVIEPAIDRNTAGMAERLGYGDRSEWR